MVIDLSNLKSNAPTAAVPDYDALPPETQEALAGMADEDPGPEGTPVRTAFLVIVNEEGSAFATPDLDSALVRSYVPTTDDIYAAVTLVAKDIETQEGAQITASFMHQLAMQAQQQMQGQALAQRLNIPRG